MVVLLLFLLGLCVGSFLNVVIDRLPKGAGVVKGGSHCDNCQHPLAGRDLVPLLSFAVLRGRCRYCGQKISWQYPLVELTTGLLFASSFFLSSAFRLLNLPSVLCILSSIFLIPIFVIDLKHGIIPDKIVFPGIAVVLGCRLLGVIGGIWVMWENLKNDVGGLGPYLLQTDFFRQHVWLELRPFLLTLLGSLVLCFLFFVLHRLFSGRAMGGGDVKLAFLVGVIAGWPNMIVAVFASFLTGAIVSVILMLVGKKRFGETVPFGPFLVAGTYIALFWGDEILGWCW